jgi:predicted nucleic acid-binding Zn ribbon protein
MQERYKSMAKSQVIGNVFTQLFRDLGIDKAIQQNAAVNRWSEIVGERISEVTEAEKIEKGILVVKVSSPVWRNELVFMKTNLIKNINDALAKNIVKDIKFT